MNDKRPIVCLCLYNLSLLVVVLQKHFGDEYFLSLDLFSFGGRRMSLIISSKRGRDTTGSDEHDKCAELLMDVANIEKMREKEMPL
jgi:hypothetical protein